MIIATDPGRLTGVFRRPVLTIGNFDGVHLGHQALLAILRREADRRSADAVILTFDPHPLQVLAPDKCPPLIQTWRQKTELFEKFGVDGVIVHPFSPAFARVAAEDFVSDLLAGKLGISALVLGERFVFGHQRRGNVALLQDLAPRLGFDVLPLSETALGPQLVSSTAIRQFLADGRLSEAVAMLGRLYAVDGTVVSGLGLGRRLGFPTANLQTDNQILLPNGVFAVTLDLEGRSLPGAASIGIRPTVDTGVPLAERRRALEVFLFDFDGDLYGRSVRVQFHSMIRPELRFGSLEELRARMARDVSECRYLLRSLEHSGR
jgi:riboflavin kinase/FMN adenylyltransferase